MQLICSTGTFSRDPDLIDHRNIERYGSQLDVPGFEVIFYSTWYKEYEQIADELRGYGVPFPAIHAEKSIGPDLSSQYRHERQEAIRKFEANCRFAGWIGAPLLVFHLWGLPESDLYIERNLDALPECVEIARDYGVALGIETVPCTRYEPLSNIARVLERDPRCQVVLDTEFLAYHNQLYKSLEAGWLWEGNDSPVRHVHIKDYDGVMVGEDGKRRYLQPDEGNIDFKRVFAMLKERGFDGNVSLESPAIGQDGTVNVQVIRDSLALLDKLINAEVEEPYEEASTNR